MEKNLNAPQYKIGDAVSFQLNKSYKVSRIAGIVYYDNGYKYLFEADIRPYEDIDLDTLLPEECIVDILK